MLNCYHTPFSTEIKRVYIFNTLKEFLNSCESLTHSRVTHVDVMLTHSRVIHVDVMLTHSRVTHVDVMLTHSRVTHVDVMFMYLSISKCYFRQ